MYPVALSRRPTFGVLLRIAVAAFLGLAAQSPGAAFAPPAGAGSELAFFQLPAARELVLSDGRRLARRFDADGASRGSTKNVALGRVAIETQRKAYNVIAAGIVAGPDESASLLADGLKALEWGFAQAGADGSFPRQQQHHGNEPKFDGVHSKAQFLGAVSRTILLIDSSHVEQPIKARARALIPPLLRSARWMAHSDGLADFLANAANTNQRLAVAVMMQETSVLTGDRALAGKARAIVAQALALQTPDGTLPERGGFDSHYQSYSTELLARYESRLPAGSWRDTVDAGLARGLRRWLGAIGPDGRLDATGNTRTSDCGPSFPGPGAKGSRADKLPLRLYYIDAVTGGRFGLRPTAARTGRAGQTFRHRERCPQTRFGLAQRTSE